MIRVRIGMSDYELKDVSESWIAEQIHRRRQESEPVCIQVVINQDGLNMMLSTQDCPSVSGDRIPSKREREIFDLWEGMHMGGDNYSGGNLIAFLKRLQSKL